MADTSVTTGKNKWIWWLVSLLGLGAIGTGIWYFFFRKESTFAQNRLKAKNAANGTNNGTSQQETTTQQETTNTQPQTQPQREPQTQSQTIQVNPPPKTEKPKDNAPKVYGDVFNDIYAPNAKKKITTASKNGKALMQALLNQFNDSGMIVVDGLWGKKSEDAYQRAKNKVMGTVGKKYGDASTETTYDKFIYDMATKKNWFTNADMDDLKAFVRKIPPKSVFLS